MHSVVIIVNLVSFVLSPAKFEENADIQTYNMEEFTGKNFVKASK